MKYIDEYRNGELAKKYLDLIAKIITHRWTIMEIFDTKLHDSMSLSTADFHNYPSVGYYLGN